MPKDCEYALNHIIDCEGCKKQIKLNQEEILKLSMKTIEEITLEKLYAKNSDGAK